MGRRPEGLERPGRRRGTRRSRPELVCRRSTAEAGAAAPMRATSPRSPAPSARGRRLPVMPIYEYECPGCGLRGSIAASRWPIRPRVPELLVEFVEGPAPDLRLRRDRRPVVDRPPGGGCGGERRVRLRDLRLRGALSDGPARSTLKDASSTADTRGHGALQATPYARPLGLLPAVGGLGGLRGLEARRSPTPNRDRNDLPLGAVRPAKVHTRTGEGGGGPTTAVHAASHGVHGRSHDHA